MFRTVRFLLAAAVVCAAVSSMPVAAADSDVDALRKKIEALDARVVSLEAQVRVLASRVPAPTAPPVAPAAPAAATPAAAAPAVASAAYEAEAQAVIDEIVRLTDQGEAQQARAKVAEIRTKYAASKVAGQASYFSNELEVIGKSAPADWGVESWFQGKDAIDLSGEPTTIVVFWEEWCPHCRDQMPRLEQFYAAHRSQGLQVLGITKVSQTATDDKVRAYLREKGIEFPVGKETGSPSTYFNVKGIPAAAILKDGKIVWRGHPIRLTDEILKRWL